jgi:hydroxyacylglutathione hydrolase
MRLPDVEFVDDATGAVIRRLSVGPLDTNCWVVFDPDTSDGVVIDPGDEVERIIDAVADITPRHIVLTHAHWDHVLGVPMLHDAFGIAPLAHRDDAPVWPHEQTFLKEHGHFDAATATADLLACGCSLRPADDAATWDGISHPVDDREIVRIGSIGITVIATPGHTPGSVSLLLGDRVFTGDTLFPGGPGLTGWPLSDFGTIIHSIDRRLFTLPDATVVHPGHGRDTRIGLERPSLGEWIERGW